MGTIRNFIDIFKSNVKYAPQTWKMAKMTAKKRYSGSALGLFWSLVNPILFMFVYWFGIQVGIRGGKPISGDIPYLFWMMPGIIAWFFVRDILNRGCGAIRRDSHLVTKVVFPVETIPVYTVISYGFTHMMLLGIVTVILAVFGHFYPDIYYIQILYYGGFMFFFACVLCMFLSTLSVISRDFEHLIQSTSMIFFWLSPILWSPDRLGEGSLAMRLIKLNPFYYFVSGYRDCFIFKKWFWERPNYTIYMIVFTIIFTWVTTYLYNKLHDEFADVL